jgi:tungstate transport system ATP-binding protein
VDVPSLQVRSGEILGIVGPSGAGKSTLLRLLNFLEAPTHGELRYHGRTAGPDLPLEVRREVVTVFQHPILLRRSVAANLRFAQRIRGISTDGEIDEWLGRLGLTELQHAAARTLSAGEAQRVALARSLIVNPSVILLDEPTGNLDPYNVGLIEEIVRADNAERGTTVVLVTHDVFQARRLAHRTGLMMDGRIIELTGTESFFDTPGHEQTAAFLRGELAPVSLPAPRPQQRRRRWWRRDRRG